MTKIERSIVIDRPPEVVWEYIHDLGNDPKWQTSVLEGRDVSEGPMAVGKRIAETRRFLGRRFEAEYEVTEFEPTRRSAIATTGGPIPFTGSYNLAPAEGGTRFTMAVEMDAAGFFKLVEPVFARMAAREVEANLGHLKDLLEAEADGRY